MTVEERKAHLAKMKDEAESERESQKESEILEKAMKYAEMEWRMGLETSLVVALKELGEIDEDKFDTFINTLMKALVDAKYNSLLNAKNLETKSKAKGRLFKSNI